MPLPYAQWSCSAAQVIQLITPLPPPFGDLLSSLVTYFFFLLLSTLCALYIKTYFIHDKSLPVVDLVLWPYMQGDVYFSHLVPSSLLPQFSAVPFQGFLCSCSQPIHHRDSGLNHESLYSFNTYFSNSPLDVSEICLFLWLHKALISPLLLQRWSDMTSARIQLFRPTPW